MLGAFAGPENEAYAAGTRRTRQAVAALVDVGIRCEIQQVQI